MPLNSDSVAISAPQERTTDMAGRRDADELLSSTPARTPRASNGSGELSHGGLSVPVERVAANPFNTRKLDTPKAKKAVAELGASILATGQVQASAVVTAGAFRSIFPVDQFPEAVESIGSAEWVQVTGGRRRAAVIATDGLSHLDIRENNDLAATRERFLAATSAENIDRADYDAVEESEAVEHIFTAVKADIDATVAAGGTPESKDATAIVGQRLGKSKSWVSKRRAIAGLFDSVKALIRKGGLSIHAAEGLGKIKDEAEQLAEVQRRVDSGYQPIRKANKGPDDAAPAPAPADPETATADPDGDDEPDASSTPARKLTGSPDELAATLRAEWTPENIGRLIELLSASE